MPQTSPSLSLPYLQPAQAQKHVTHNEALRILDAVTQLSVQDATLTEPPAVPAEGARYVVNGVGTGAWVNRDFAVAIWSDTAWHFVQPTPGWRADVAATGDTLRFDGTAWVTVAVQGGVAPVLIFSWHWNDSRYDEPFVHRCRRDFVEQRWERSPVKVEQSSTYGYRKPAVPNGVFRAS
jgi:hypothetical protein